MLNVILAIVNLVTSLISLKYYFAPNIWISSGEVKKTRTIKKFWRSCKGKDFEFILSAIYYRTRIFPNIESINKIGTQTLWPIKLLLNILSLKQ